MLLKRYFVNGLAHASYLIGDGGQAAVVDPKRDVDDYINDASKHGLEIVAILNTHPHADFASGFIELAQRTGAKIYTSYLAPASYEREPAQQGVKIALGNLEVEVLETPGHSPDSLSFLVRDNGEPTTVFTGDLIFVNDVGRPDLRDADEDPTALAEKLYDSLFGKILSLPPKTRIYPAHGAGSLCGRAISSAPYSTVEDEKTNNWAALLTDRSEFVKRMTANLPDRPAYFGFDVGVNFKGAPAMSELPQLNALTEPDLQAAAADGTVIIDTRSASFFGAGHVPGSLNIGIASPLFSTWVGFLVPGESRIVLVVGSLEAAEQARLELARIGFDNIAGYVEADSLQQTGQLSQMSVCDLKASLATKDKIQVVDVRTPGEWAANHIDSAIHIPLPKLTAKMAQLAKNQPMALICGSGYRSSIAASLLRASGFTSVRNVMGGMGAFTDVRCPQLQPAELILPDIAI